MATAWATADAGTAGATPYGSRMKRTNSGSVRGCSV